MIAYAYFWRNWIYLWVFGYVFLCRNMMYIRVFLHMDVLAQVFISIYVSICMIYSTKVRVCVPVRMGVHVCA